MAFDSTSEASSITPTYLGNGWISNKRVLPIMPDEHVQYGYDNLGRAETMKRVASTTTDLETYSYDDAGNLTAFSDLNDNYLYPSVQRFGEGGTRNGGLTSDAHTWDVTSSRMRTWEHFTGLQSAYLRTFNYDAAGRLVGIQDTTNADTELFYDVDDQLVYEDQAGTIIERFDGMRHEGSKQNGTYIEQVLPTVRVVTKDGVLGRTVTFKTVLPDLDGHAVFVFDEYGVEERREVTGIYGRPVDFQGGPEVWVGGTDWAIDGLHGAEEDEVNEVTHYGARHVLSRDGLWMQPDPLLAIGVVATIRSMPGNFGSSYAAANPLVWHDLSGFKVAGLTIQGPSDPSTTEVQPTKAEQDRLAQQKAEGERKKMDEALSFLRVDENGNIQIGNRIFNHDGTGKIRSRDEIAAAAEDGVVGNVHTHPKKGSRKPSHPGRRRAFRRAREHGLDITLVINEHTDQQPFTLMVSTPVAGSDDIQVRTFKGDATSMILENVERIAPNVSSDELREKALEVTYPGLPTIPSHGSSR